MGFDFAAAKAKVRRVVHDSLSTPGEYDDGDLLEPVPLRVRWHNSVAVTGDNGEAYPVSIDNIDKVIFEVAELTAQNVAISRGGRLKLTAPFYGGQVLVIDTRDPKSDAAWETWNVGRHHGKLNP